MKHYQGRRRLPKLPGKRYFAVVSTAVMAAGVVALGAGAMIPDDLSNADGAGNTVALDDRLAAADRAARAADDGPAISIVAGATDVWLLPIRDGYTVTSGFAVRWDGMHFGVDLGAPAWTPIHATHAGTVLIAGWNGGYGNCVQIDNGNGITTIFGHAVDLNVAVGQQVAAGDVIAWVGTTGYSTGNHLHYEIRVDEGTYDPMRFMLERGVDLGKRTEEATGGVVIG